MEAFVIITILFFLYILFAFANNSKKKANKNISISRNTTNNSSNVNSSNILSPSSNSFQNSIPNTETVSLKIEVRIGNDSVNNRIDQKNQYEWIPFKKSVAIKNFTINDGLLYVGTKLASRQNYTYSDEPSLINPSLDVNTYYKDLEATDLTYWPAYANISPSTRAAYLNWLCTGRNVANAPIGFVFLFFYGLERRVFVDLEKETNSEELNVIKEEVQRLLKIYGNNNSFNRYSSNFIDVIAGLSRTGNLELPLKNTAEWGDCPVVFKLLLAEYALEKKQLPASLAIKWLEYDSNTYFRTPAQRCKEEFNSLFTIKYNNKYPNGLVLKPNKTKITINYYPASSALPRPITRKLDDLPDLTRLTSYLEQFRQIAIECENELDALSRYLGRKPDERNSLAAASLLPKELLNFEGNKLIDNIKKTIRDYINQKQFAVIEINHFLKQISLEISDKLSKQDVINIIQLLDKLDIGIEPDIRFGNSLLKVNDKAVIFPLHGKFPEAPTKEYSATMLIVTLSAALSAADDNFSDEEKHHIIEHIESALNLTKEERIRLTAYMNWATLSAIDMKGLAKKLSELNNKQKSQLANFLITFANADGYISPDEIKILKKVYTAFGFDENKLYSDIHNIQTGTAELPTIIPAEKNKVGYKIPKPKKDEVKVVLDETLVQKTLKDTNEIQKILTTIFVKEDDKSVIVTSDSITTSNDNTIFNLDADHTNLIKELMKKVRWKRAEFEEICNQMDLLPDGAIETINDTFFRQVEDDLLIEDVEIEINTLIFEKINDFEKSDEKKSIIQEIKVLENIFRSSAN